MKRTSKCKQLFKTVAFLVLSCVLSANFAGCNDPVNDSKHKESPKVKINVQGDGNVKVKTPSFMVEKGAKWKDVKNHPAIKGITFTGNFILDGWKLNNKTGNPLIDSYTFNVETTVFAVSKSTGGSTTEEVTITIDGDANVKSGKNFSFKVDKGTKWETVKTRNEITSVTFNPGFELDVWKLESATGNELSDAHAFNANTTVFAVSKAEVPKKQVTITVHGDSNVASGKGGSFNVDEGTKWATVKTRNEITSVTFNPGFELGMWKLHSSAGKELEDNDAFTANTTIFVSSKKIVVGNVTITVDGDSHMTSGKGSFEVTKGTTWETVKTNQLIKNITFQDDYELDSWKLGTSSGNALQDSYAFNENATVYAVSKAKEKITITVDGDTNVTSSFKNQNFQVNKGSTWASIRENEKIKNVTFNSGFELQEWKKDGSDGATLKDTDVFDASATVYAVSRANNTVTQITITVSGDANVTDSCKNKTFKVDPNTKWETVKENVAITSVTFNAGYYLDVWKLTNENGNDLEDTHTFTQDATVYAVSTRYKKVKYSELDAYMNASASTQDVNYIEVTEVEASNLLGSYPSTPSNLGKILRKYNNKKVALKLPKTIASLTDMSYCFLGCKTLKSLASIPESVTGVASCFEDCTILEQAPAIPANVTDMSSCFSGCESLTQAPTIPSKVTNMFKCFANCTELVQAPSLPQDVTNISKCFDSCAKITQAPTIPSKVTNMSGCFKDCSELTAAPQIPGSVTNMGQCFMRCAKLVSVPNSIPQYVNNMASCFMGCTKLKTVTLDCAFIDGGPFMMAFMNCSALEAGGIKVKETHLTNYQNNAASMGTTQDKFAKQN